MANPKPVGGSLTKSAGELSEPYEVIGLTFGYAIRSGEGCSNSLDNLSVFQEASKSLELAAAESGADAIIHINFQQRDTVTSNCGASGKPAVEVYAWGTAVRKK